jgi:hypothetical protein
MKVVKFSEYVKESQEVLNDGILIVVDVQKEFSEFQPKNYVHNVFEYCKQFPKDDNSGRGVYQIWDSNKAQNFSYNFPNTLMTVRKNYGTKFDANIKKTADNLMLKFPKAKEGDKFKFKDKNAYMVRINNNHKWFYVNEDLYNLYLKLKGKTVVIVGGAGGECEFDIRVSMHSFGINPVPNKEYIYDAKMSDEQVVKPK